MTTSLTETTIDSTIRAEETVTGGTTPIEVSTPIVDNKKITGKVSKKSPGIQWSKEPSPREYNAATEYLTLLYGPDIAKDYVAKLVKAPIIEFKIRDIFRSSGLSTKGISKDRVERDTKMIDNGEKLSPILLVRDRGMSKTVVARGFHHLVSVFKKDETCHVPCKIVG